MPDITIENFKEVLEKEPELKNTILTTYKPEAKTFLEQDGFIIRSKEDDEQFINNHLNTRTEDEIQKRLPTIIKTEYGKAMAKIDEEIFKITGVPKAKEGHEKSTEYLARAWREKKTGDPETNQRVRELEALLAEKEEEFSSKLSEIKQQTHKQTIESQVDNTLAPKQFNVPPTAKTEQDKKAYAENQKRLIRNDFFNTHTSKVDGEGNTIFYRDGKPLLSPGNGKPLTAQEIIERDYSLYFVQASNKAAGSGAGAGASDDKTDPQIGDFKSKEDVHKYLGSIGLEAGSKEYSMKFESLITEAKIAL